MAALPGAFSILVLAAQPKDGSARQPVVGIKIQVGLGLDARPRHFRAVRVAPVERVEKNEFRAKVLRFFDHQAGKKIFGGFERGESFRDPAALGIILGCEQPEQHPACAFVHYGAGAQDQVDVPVAGPGGSHQAGGHHGESEVNLSPGAVDEGLVQPGAIGVIGIGLLWDQVHQERTRGDGGDQGECGPERFPERAFGGERGGAANQRKKQ